MPGGERCPVCVERYRQQAGADRGYGVVHQTLREQWAARIANGEEVDCHAPVCKREQQGGSRRILPGEPWDLGHKRGDRRKWSGPEHPACNRDTSEKW